MSDFYTTSHLVQLFAIAPQSVRNWSEIFQRYLSTAAAPGKGRSRTFTGEDVRVFAVIASMKKNGASNDEIHASLSAGVHRSMPELPAPSDIQNLVVSDSVKALATLTQRIELLEVENENLLTRAQQAEEKGIQLESKNELLSEQLKAAQEEIKKLNREIGKLETRLEDD